MVSVFACSIYVCYIRDSVLYLFLWYLVFKVTVCVFVHAIYVCVVTLFVYGMRIYSFSSISVCM